MSNLKLNTLYRDTFQYKNYLTSMQLNTRNWAADELLCYYTRLFFDEFHYMIHLHLPTPGMLSIGSF